MPICTLTQVPFRSWDGVKSTLALTAAMSIPTVGWLLRQVERRPQLLKAVAKVSPDPRGPDLVRMKYAD